MIRIRTGASWRDDPRIAAALRGAAPAARAAAARELADALAIEVDGVDLAGGRAEAPLLPSLEELLGAISRILGGARQASVMLGDGGLELILRRRGQSALLTLVALGRTSRLLARDVEVDVEALAAAALEAAAGFCRDLAAAVPGAARDARHLRAAVRRLARARPLGEAPAADGPPPEPTLGNLRPAPGRCSCAIEISDEEGLLAAYGGGRPDLGSLLVPGRVALHAPDGAELLALPGHPFLALRDLAAAADRALCAARRGEARVGLPLARPGHGESTLELDLARRTSLHDGRPLGCAPLPLLRAFVEAALDFCALVRERNPRQAENAHLSELEAAAAERIAELDELAGGDVPHAGDPAPARAPAAIRPSREPLGPGSLRRLSFRRVAALEVGAPAQLTLRGSWVLAAGRGAIACLDRRTGAVRWRSRGAALARSLSGMVVAAGPDGVRALAASNGGLRWERDLPGAPPTGAVRLGTGAALLAEPGAVTALDPATGERLWRFLAPGASRTWALALGTVLLVGSDSGFLHALDSGGRLLWRVRAPGPITRAPTAWGSACLALCETASGSVLLAVEVATGLRRFEAPLDLAPSSPALPWGRRLVVPGTVAGDPAVTVLERDGSPAWTAVPQLAGAPVVLPAGPLLAVRDGAGALLALDRDGATRWARPAPPGHAAGPLALSRGTLVVGGDGLACHAVETGEIVGVLPAVSASLLAVDGELTVAALDLDGLLTVHRLGTHLSVV
jgi:outer membrane protein assembly factor BamB